MTYKANTRDVIVVAVCNWLMNTFATREYTALLRGIVATGMAPHDVEARLEERLGDALQTPPDNLTIPEFRRQVIQALRRSS